MNKQFDQGYEWEPVGPGRNRRRMVALVAGTTELVKEIGAHLRFYDMEIHHVTEYGQMAAVLLEEPAGTLSKSFLFILDLRASHGASVIKKRLADYDAVLGAFVTTNLSWPTTVCLVDREQTHPLLLSSQPHLRATLLADEVETVVGDVNFTDWHQRFASALARCWSADLDL